MSLTITIKSIQDIIRKDVGVDGDAQRIGQMVWMLFLKIFDVRESEAEPMEDDQKSLYCTRRGTHLLCWLTKWKDDGNISNCCSGRTRNGSAKDNCPCRFYDVDDLDVTWERNGDHRHSLQTVL